MRMRTLVGPLLVAGLAAVARRLARPASEQPWHDGVHPADPDRLVRRDDLEAIARTTSEPLDGFLARLDQLGVVVSHN